MDDFHARLFDDPLAAPRTAAEAEHFSLELDQPCEACSAIYLMRYGRLRDRTPRPTTGCVSRPS